MKPSVHGPHPKTGRVLLVEDDAGDARLIQELVADEGGGAFQLQCVGRLSEGLAGLAEGGFDLVLLDLSLPDSERLETLDAVRMQEPQTPIVVLTGLEDESVALEAVRRGAQDYLVKGQFEGPLLVRAMRYAVERQRMQAELREHADALRASEMRLRTIIQSNLDPIVVVDRVGIVQFINPAAETLFGRKARELIGEPLGIPITSGPATEIEFDRANGDPGVAEMRSVVIEWEGRNARLVLLHDITEQKQAEQKLRASRASFHNIVEKGGDGIVVLDGEAAVRFVNPAARQLLGPKGKRLIGQPFEFPLRPRETTEIEIEREDGSAGTAEMRLVETHWEGQEAWLALLRDRTDRKRAEHDLQKSEERYRNLVRAIGDVVYEIDPGGHVLFANEAVRSLGYEPSELVGKHFTELVHPDDVEQVSRNIILEQYAGTVTGDEKAPKLFDERRTGERRTIGLEVRLVPKGWAPSQNDATETTGSIIVLGDVVATGQYHDHIHINGRDFLGTVGVIRDITERKRIENELREARDELEVRVQERTEALTRANAALQAEIEVRTRAQQQILKQTSLLRGINRVLHETLTSETSEEIASTCLTVAQELTGSQFGFIGELSDADHLGVIAVSDPGWDACRMPKAEALRALADVPVGGYWGRVIREERSTTVNDPDSDPDRGGVPEGHPPITNFLGVPLKQAGRATGLIALANKESGYDSTDVEAAEALSVAFVEALSRQRAEQALYQYTQRLETLSEIDEAILAARSPEAIAEAALERVRELLPSHRVSLIEFAPETGQATVLAVHPQGETKLGPGSQVPITHFESFEHLEKGEVRRVDDLGPSSPSAIDQTLYEEGVRSSISVPLITQGTLVGTLNVGADTANAFTDEHLEIAREVAYPLAITLHQARLTEQIQTHAAELEQRVAERTQELKEINRELENFSYSISHDLQVPLRALKGFAQILRDEHSEQLDADGRETLGVMIDGAGRMQQLVNGLLAFSRAGRKKITPSLVNMDKLVGEAFAELSAALPERRVQLQAHPLPDAHGDSVMIRQVLANLLSNAIKFTGPVAAPCIEVGATTTEKGNTYYVKDNGVGFDDGYSKEIFGVFQRLHSIEEFEGAGAGLAIVQRIIHRHGGRVWAEGKVNEGATFHFTLPHREEE